MPGWLEAREPLRYWIPVIYEAEGRRALFTGNHSEIALEEPGNRLLRPNREQTEISKAQYGCDRTLKCARERTTKYH